MDREALLERVPVFTLPSIFEGSEVPPLIAHDAEGDWQVLDGQSVEGNSGLSRTRPNWLGVR